MIWNYEDVNGVLDTLKELFNIVCDTYAPPKYC